MTERGGYIRRDETWEGDNVLLRDVVVAPRATLRLAAGTRLRADPDGVLPEGMPLESRGSSFLSAHRRWGRRLLVLGSLEAAGSEKNPACICAPGFGGLVLLGAGRARLEHVRFEGGEGFAISMDDFTSLTASDCGFEGGLGAVVCARFSRAALRRCRVSGSSNAGLLLRDEARARLRACSFESCRRGVAAERHASFCLRGGELIGNELALEVLGGSRVGLHGTAVRRNKTGLWVQGEARVSLSSARFSENGTGLRLSHRSRGRGRNLAFERQDRAAILLEEGSRLALDGGRFEGDQNGVLALNSARADLRRCWFTSCLDTAVWIDRRARAAVSEGAFNGNARDFHEARSSLGRAVRLIFPAAKRSAAE